MSPATFCSWLFFVAYGENPSRTFTPSRPSVTSCAEAALPNTSTPSSHDQYDSSAAVNALTGRSPWTTTALFDWTKKPRQLNFVEPQTTACTLAPSTTIVLLCWRLPRC